MSAHLPECPYTDTEFKACICPALRACEQRVRIDWEMSNGPAFDFARGYAAGLSAARDAVAALVPRADTATSLSGFYIPKASALAAIDALRGDA